MPAYVFRKWARAGVVAHIRDQLRRRIRTGLGRCPYPVTLIVDSQCMITYGDAVSTDDDQVQMSVRKV